MKVTKKTIDALNLELTLEIAAEDYAPIEKKKFAEHKRNAEFKGFRKGMAPASLIQRVYGEQCTADAVNEVLSEQLDKFIRENDLHILGEPLASEKQPEIDWKNSTDYTFIFDLGLSPEVNVETSKDDTVNKYSITIDAKEQEEMAANMKKYYEEKKEEKSDEDIEKEVKERLQANYKQEAEWRLSKDIRDFYVEKAGVELPEEFLKRWLFVANGGKVSKEDIEKEFAGFVADFKWQLVRGAFMKKYDFKIGDDELKEAARAYITYQYAMYGLPNVPEEMIDEAMKNVMSDNKQLDRIIEQVEDQKVIGKLREEVTIKSKRISAAKFRELK